MFGSLWFVGALATAGLMADAILWALSRKVAWLRFCVAAGTANAGLLVFYWVLIFPQTKGWVLLADVPLLVVVSLGGGLAAGYVGCRLSESMRGILSRIVVR